MTIHETATPSPTAEYRPSSREYASVGGILVLFGLLLTATVVRSRGLPSTTDQLVAPMGAMAALTAVVCLSMAVVRISAIVRGTISAQHYVAYQSPAPADWIERPARTFNNLMQVPPLFYVVCLLMMATGRLDQAQVALAWLYVATRAVHATVYIGWNYLPFRFASFAASCLVLMTMWTRALLD